MSFLDQFRKKERQKEVNEQELRSELMSILASQPPHFRTRFLAATGSKEEMEELLVECPQLRPIVERMVALLLTKERDVTKLVEEFVNANSWAKSKVMVETHPELLTDKADALLIQTYKEEKDPVNSQIWMEHHLTLRRCREEGIDDAFEYWIAIEKQTFYPDISKQDLIGSMISNSKLYQMLEFSFVPKNIRVKAVEAQRNAKYLYQK